MNDSDIEFVANEETVNVRQQKNQNEKQNLLISDAHNHVDKSIVKLIVKVVTLCFWGKKGANHVA